MTKNIIIIVLILGFIASVIFLDIPMVQGVLDTRKSIENQQKTLIEKNEFIETVSSLATKYKGNEDVLNQLRFILPNDEDIPNLVVQLEALAVSNGIILSDTTITKAEKDENSPIDYAIININLRLNGSYEAFKSFLASVENNMRLIDIDTINFQAEGVENSKTFDFDVIFKTYYQINQTN